MRTDRETHSCWRRCHPPHICSSYTHTHRVRLCVILHLRSSCRSVCHSHVSHKRTHTHSHTSRSHTFICCSAVAGLPGPNRKLLLRYLSLMLVFLSSRSASSLFFSCSTSSQHCSSKLQHTHTHGSNQCTGHFDTHQSHWTSFTWLNSPPGRTGSAAVPRGSSAENPDGPRETHAEPSTRDPALCRPPLVKLQSCAPAGQHWSRIIL